MPFISNPKGELPTLEILVSGKVTDRDCAGLAGTLPSMTHHCEPIRLLFDMTEFDGWMTTEEQTVLPKAEGSSGVRVSRIAIVGERAWETGGRRLAMGFEHSEVRYFCSTEVGDARQWLGDPPRERIRWKDARMVLAPREPRRERLSRPVTLA
jgi:hypothetical protein